MNGDYSLAVHALVYLDHRNTHLPSQILAENICTNAARVRKVMRPLAAAGLGWSGFEVVPKNTELLERMRRKRMAADHFRGKLDWTALRGWDLALGAALITKAQAADMLTDEEALDYFRRIAGELLLRMTSRQALARAMLLGTFWTTLEVGEQQAAEGLRQAEQALDSLLSPEGVWGRTPWVQQKADANPPTVYV